MKKLFALLALALCLLSTVAVADASQCAGAYALAHPTDSGGALFEMFLLAEDGRLYYSNASFTGTESNFSRQYVGSWTETADGLHLKYGEKAEADAKVVEDFLLIDLSGKSYPYGRVLEWPYM